EDPSDKFIALRDLVSLELCHKYLPDLFSKESILKTNRLTKEIINKAQNVCKLTQFDEYHDLQLSMPEIRKAYLDCQYQHILKHYKNILRTFDKYHLNLYFISNILFK
ncbi:unnamed protein product, partial [Rotaria sp. Silwood2]